MHGHLNVKFLLKLKNFSLQRFRRLEKPEVVKATFIDSFDFCVVFKSSPDTFPIRNGLQKETHFRHKILNTALGDARRRVQVNQETSRLNGTHQLMVVIYWGKILI